MPVLVIQMGHVGRPPCPGSVGTAGEQDFTRRAGEACARLFDGRGGWTVKIIDADPGYFSVRQEIGGDPTRYRGEAFVAIHCDGSDNTARNGASFGYRTDEGNRLAQAIKAAYLRRTGRAASWLEPDNYTSNLAGYYGTGLAVGQGNRRAVIFETGFLTNPDDRAMLLAPSGPDNVALAIGDALGIPLPATAAAAEEDDMFDAGDRRKLDAIMRSLLGDYDPGKVGEGAQPLPGSVGANVRTLLAQGGTDADTLRAALAPIVKPAVVEALAEHGAVDLDPETMEDLGDVVVRRLGASIVAGTAE